MAAQKKEESDSNIKDKVKCNSGTKWNLSAKSPWASCEGRLVWLGPVISIGVMGNPSTPFTPWPLIAESQAGHARDTHQSQNAV